MSRKNWSVDDWVIIIIVTGLFGGIGVTLAGLGVCLATGGCQ